MTLGVRKAIVVSAILAIFLFANILVVASWIAEKGIDEKANWIREEFLTGTAIAVIVALLILLVNPNRSSKTVGLMRRCPVCDHVLLSRGSYCSDCGSRL
jgi:hypothetical protein